MNSKEIKEAVLEEAEDSHALSYQLFGIEYWLREVAFQLAVMNEGAGCDMEGRKDA